MGGIFFNIAGTVLVLNILFLLIPDGKFSKYVQFVAGLIVMLTVAGNFLSLDIDHSIIHFDDEALSYDSRKLEKSVRDEIIAESVKTRIEEKFGIEADVMVKTESNSITEVTVFTDCRDTEKIAGLVMQYCDINRESVVIK